MPDIISMVTRLTLLSWILGLTASLAHAQPATTGLPRLVLDADTGIRIRESFDAEILYEVPKSQGSWVAMAFDPKVRLIVSD